MTHTDILRKIVQKVDGEELSYHDDAVMSLIEEIDFTELLEELYRLRNALHGVRQELWIDYCLRSGRTDVDPSGFDAKPHIRIIDKALGHGG